MHSCRCLDLTNGRLSREPFEPEHLTALTSLRLNNNGIKGIQASTFKRLSSLTWLELHNNQLAHLPEEIGNLTALKALLLHNNLLVELPESMTRLSSLTMLTLANNSLTYPVPNLEGSTPEPVPISFPAGWTLALQNITCEYLDRYYVLRNYYTGQRRDVARK